MCIQITNVVYTSDVCLRLMSLFKMLTHQNVTSQFILPSHQINQSLDELQHWEPVRVQESVRPQVISHQADTQPTHQLMVPVTQRKTALFSDLQYNIEKDQYFPRSFFLNSMYFLSFSGHRYSTEKSTPFEYMHFILLWRYSSNYLMENLVHHFIMIPGYNFPNS